MRNEMKEELELKLELELELQLACSNFPLDRQMDGCSERLPNLIEKWLVISLRVFKRRVFGKRAVASSTGIVSSGVVMRPLANGNVLMKWTSSLFVYF